MEYRTGLDRIEARPVDPNGLYVYVGGRVRALALELDWCEWREWVGRLNSVELTVEYEVRLRELLRLGRLTYAGLVLADVYEVRCRIEGSIRDLVVEFELREDVLAELNVARREAKRIVR